VLEPSLHFGVGTRARLHMVQASGEGRKNGHFNTSLWSWISLSLCLKGFLYFIAFAIDHYQEIRRSCGASGSMYHICTACTPHISI
jgi:hypothetical protein